eukprot:m51a1_g11940 putative 4fe-4s ferredoxin iron-sulfur binding domain-containing protein (281) ;mRNA; r:728098-728940
MATRVAMLYCSFTGNTAHVAELLRDALTAQGFEASATDVTGPGVDRSAVCDAVSAADALAVGAVVVGGLEPTKFRELLESLPERSLKGKPALVFATAAIKEYGVLGSLSGCLTRKGAVVVGSLVVYAPSNFIPWGAPQGSTFQWGSRERDKPAAFARDVAPLLRARPPTAVMTGEVEDLGLAQFDANDERMRQYVGRLAVDKGSCARCGLCVRLCPEGALQRGPDGVPRWDMGKCRACCRCINHCPKNCITSPPTRNKQQYRCKPEWFVDGDFSYKEIQP